MEKEIEYEETVQRQETVVLCDDCTREVDEDGRKYVPASIATDQGDQPLSVYQRFAGDRLLDLCSECIEDLGADGDEPDVYIPAEDWTKDHAHRHGLASRVNTSRGFAVVFGLMALTVVYFFNGLLEGVIMALYILTVYFLFTFDKKRIEEDLVHP